LTQELYPEDGKDFKASSGWLKRFLARHGMCWRRRNDKATVSVDKLVLPVARFISDLRKLRLSTVGQVGASPEYGMYDHYRTLNVDQIPLPFASADVRTIDFVGVGRVWIRSAGSGLEKRQCTLQLLIRAKGKQPIPCLIFRGQPVPTKNKKKRQIEMDNIKRLAPNVLILWQNKAWADLPTCLDWVQQGLEPFLESEKIKDKCLLLTDGLSSQVHREFGPAVKEAGARYPPPQTHTRTHTHTYTTRITQRQFHGFAEASLRVQQRGLG